MKLHLLSLFVLVVALSAFGTCEPAKDFDADDDDDATPRRITGGEPSTPPTVAGPTDRWLTGLPAEHRNLLTQTVDPASSEAAHARLVELGPQVVGSLQDAALLASDPEMSGHAIRALASIEHDSAEQTLTLIHQRSTASPLVRAWAAAARIQRTQTMEQLSALSSLANEFPAVSRPMGIRAVALMGDDADVASMIQLSLSNSNLQQAFAEPILAAGAGPLAEVMFTHADNNVRRLAAGYLGTLGNRGEQQQLAIIDTYTYVPGLSGVPWAGGALYVPAVSWDQAKAREIVARLLAWHVHCDLNGLNSEKQQIYNNLRSVGLHRVAGMQWPVQDTKGLLDQWAAVVGKDEVRQLLSVQGASAKYGYGGGAKVTK
ncbi:MAG: hypothetical protein GY898_25565 [Proteobacteria bacterium]|nr:hypothetical protein [Pseudomonadota bacterium]